MSETASQEKIFQRTFWSRDDAGKWDGLSRYGFWLCFLVGAYTSYVEVANREYALACASLLAYWIAACGIRERSTLAAILATTWVLTGEIGNRIMGLPLIPVDVFATVLLAVSTYWTALGSRTPIDENTGQPVGRRNRNIVDKFVDQLPVQIWKSMRTPFFIICGGIVLLCVYSTIQAARQGSMDKFAPLENDPRVQTTPSR